MTTFSDRMKEREDEMVRASTVEDKLLGRKLEIERVLVVSTVHLSMKELKTPGSVWPVHCLESEYSFEAYVGDVDDPASAWNEDVVDWPGLIEVGKFAQARGIDWVRFDRDANEVEGLTTYEW